LLGICDINIDVASATVLYVHPMQGLVLLALLTAEHNSSHWNMDCATWNQNRIEILSDQNLPSYSKEYLIDYFYSKTDGSCKPFIIGRK